MPLIGAFALTALTAIGASPARARSYDCEHRAMFPDIPDSGYGRLLTIVIDKTVHFPETTVGKLVGWSMAALHDGDDVEIVSFSANTIDQSPTVELRDHVRQPLTDVEVLRHYSIPFAPAARWCRQHEIDIARSRVQTKLRDLAINPVADDIRSEIVETLSKMPAVPPAPGSGRDPIVIIASDMMENASPDESFYRPANLRPEHLIEYLDRLQAMGLVGHMRGARVYVIGASTIVANGFAPSTIEQNDIKRFWCRWFRMAGARIAGWGTGDLFEDPRAIDTQDGRASDACGLPPP